MSRLAAEPADLLVIGGGITGAGIARDAAMRGLRTVIIDQGDFGSGTSSRSSRLIHGGLRYLEERDFRLVFEASRERRILLAIAPHLVRPLAFIFPVHRGDRVPLWKLAAGAWLYDLLALFRNVGRHRILGKRALLRAEPRLLERGLTGGVRYFDAQCDDARLVIATLRSALAHGAAAANYVRAEALEMAGGRVSGAKVEDLLTGERATIRATLVVNATGPWSDRTRRLEDPAAQRLLRPTKGAHVMVPRERLGHTHAITITSPLDGRIMFALPWGNFSYIGTTDTDSAESPDAVHATPDDVVYLLRSANAYFPTAHLTERDVIASWAALRPLLTPAQVVGASQVPREHRIVQGPGGMFTIVGGKLTTYRAMAAELVDLVAVELRRLGQWRQNGYRATAGTQHEPLPGGEALDFGPFRQQALDLGLSPETAEHLIGHYGTEAAAVCNLVRDDRALAAPLHSHHPAIAAEVLHVVRRELALKLDDVLVRRIHLYYETPDRGAEAAAKVAELMGRELGWEGERVTAEVEGYEVRSKE